MSLFDCINGVQVHCLNNNLKQFKSGDKLPLKTRTYQYPDSIMFLQTIYPGIKPYEKQIHIIKDSIIEKTIEVGDLVETDFDGIQGIFSDTGKKMNINNFEDLIAFLYEDCKLQLDIDFLAFNREGNAIVNEKREELERAFYEKWYA